MTSTHAPLRFASRMSRMKASEVREILKVTEQPEILSFAGGLPAPELFPVEALAEAHARVFAESGGQAMQYSTSEGFGPLRAWIAARLRSLGVDATPERILVTHGSQQGLDLVCKVLLDPGDEVVVENPSYLAALQVFGGYQATLVPVGSDDDGMDVNELESVLRMRRPKLIYLTPTFQNPRGTTLSLERRRSLVQLAADHGVPVLEDDPYGELRYRGERLPSLAALGGSDSPVIYASTFSKTLSPGIRLGWVLASDEAIPALTIAKQAADLHTSTLLQRAVARMLATFDYEGHLGRIRAAYGQRCQAMLDSLAREMPGDVRWTRPEGGLFIWCRLPEGIRGDVLLRSALKQKVAFVPGAAFFAARPEHEYIRLNFSNRPPEAIADGIGRVARVLAAERGALREAAPRNRQVPPART
jgi:2-aminoadipate transaminase